MKKISLAVTVLALALGACGAQTDTTNTDTSSSSSTNAPAMKRAAMEWVAVETDAGTDGTAPKNTITLRVAGTQEEIYSTTCAGVPSTDVQIDGSVASVRCWFAGGGDDYAVFIGDAEQLTVRHRTVDEEGGFGEWEDLAAR